MKKKSNKQRRAEIMEKRQQRVQSWQRQLEEARTVEERRRIAALAARLGGGVVMADTQLLAAHSNSYGLPDYYIDKPFQCADCNAHEVWTAKQQKWWYEVARGNINSTARFCAECRRKRRVQRTQSKQNNPMVQQQAALRALAGQRPNAAAWETIENAIANKRWSTRVVAIQTVGQWWGQTRSAETLAWLLRWMDEAPKKIYVNSWPYMAAEMASKTIARHIRASDMPWVMQRVLDMDEHDVTPRSLIWHLVLGMPSHAVLETLASPKYHKALHDDPVLAPRLALMLAHCNENAPGNFAPWAKLVRHALASPLYPEKLPAWLQQLQQRLKWHESRHATGLCNLEN